MSIIKTVLTTTAVLFLGAVITLGYQVAVYQRDRIDALQKQLTSLQGQIVSVQNQTVKDSARLNRTIKTTNENFETVTSNQDELKDAVLGIIDILKSVPSPSNFTQSRNNGS